MIYFNNFDNIKDGKCTYEILIEKKIENKNTKTRIYLKENLGFIIKQSKIDL